MKKCWLITLEGQGDVEIRVVDKETFDWVTKGTPTAEEMKSSSWENDRMLACETLADFPDYFDHLGTALKAIKAKDYEVEDTVDGYIY